MKEYLKKYKLYIIIGVCTLVLLVGGTLAYYVWKSNTTALVNLNICTPTVTFVGGSTINGVDMVPVLTKEDGTIKDIEVKKNSTCNRDVTMSLYLELTTFPTGLSDSSFVYELYKNNGSTPVVKKNFSNKQEGDTITLLSNQVLNTSKDTYTLYIYIDGSVDNPIEMAGKSFIFKLWGAGEGAIYKENVMTTSDDPTDSTSKFFDTEVMREEIQSLTIAEDNTVPDIEGVVSKDISSNNDGTVMLWYTPKEVTSSNGTTKTMYDMWIGGKNGVLQTGSNASGMFAYLTNVEKLDLTKLDTSYITNMSKMFYNSSGLKTIDLSNFNTSSVTNMSQMFTGCTGLNTIDVSSFDTSNVTYMNDMFRNCTSLTSINLSNFDTSNVSQMYYMFYYCIKLTSVDLSNFDTRKVSSAFGMFRTCRALQTIIFGENCTFEQLEDMGYMFSDCSKLKNLNLSMFNTSKVTDMSYTFYGCQKLVELDLSNFNTSNVTSMSNMFNYCSSLTNLDLSNFNTSKVKSMYQMFRKCSSLERLDLSAFDTSNVTDMSVMFSDCNNLESLKISSFNTKKVTNMKNMFYYCTSLKNLDLDNFDTSNVTNMQEMFRNCNNLESLKISSFDTSKVTNMQSMFYECTILKTIYVSDLWNTSKVTSSTSMFNSCTSLVGTVSYDETKTDATMANYTTGYLTYKSNS